MNLVGIVSIISLFVVAPLIVFGFVYLNKRDKNKLNILQYQKEIAEIELKKEEAKVRFIEEENKKYDRLINEK